MRDSQLKSKPGRHQPHRRECTHCTAEGPSTVLYGYVNLTSLHGHMQPGHGRGRILGIDNSCENLWSSTRIFSMTYCEIFSCVQEMYKLLLLPCDWSTLLSLADFWRSKARQQTASRSSAAVSHKLLLLACDYSPQNFHWRISGGPRPASRQQTADRSSASAYYKLLLLACDWSAVVSLADFWRPKANIQATNSWQEVSRNTSCLSSRPRDRGRYSSKIFNRTDDIQIRFYLEEKGRLSEKSYFVRK